MMCVRDELRLDWEVEIRQRDVEVPLRWGVGDRPKTSAVRPRLPYLWRPSQGAFIPRHAGVYAYPSILTSVACPHRKTQAEPVGSVEPEWVSEGQATAVAAMRARCRSPAYGNQVCQAPRVRVRTQAKAHRTLSAGLGGLYTPEPVESRQSLKPNLHEVRG